MKLTHFSRRGSARMVDVSGKAVSHRIAVARGWISMSEQTLATVAAKSGRKGDVLAVAQISGITGAKRTADLIPLCHPLPLSRIEVELSVAAETSRVEITATVATDGRTGVEMEALTAVCCAALTVYDMLKSVDRSMEIGEVRLVSKEGGKSGRFEGRA